MIVALNPELDLDITGAGHFTAVGHFHQQTLLMDLQTVLSNKRARNKVARSS
jgi:hypothetical protein